MTAPLLESAAAALALLRPEIDDALSRVPAGSAAPPRLRETASALRVAGFAAAASRMSALAEGGAAGETRVHWGALAAWLGEIDDRGMDAPTDLAPLHAARVRIADDIGMPAPPARDALRAARADYEQGLLEWLRGGDGGLIRMRDALSVLELLPGAGAPLWWTGMALVDAAGSGGAVQDDKILLGQLGRAIGRLAAPDGGTAQALRELQRGLFARLAPGVPLMDAACAQAVTLAGVRWRNLLASQHPGDAAALAGDARVLRAHWRAAGEPALAELWSAVVELGESTALTRALAAELDIEMSCAFAVSAAAARGAPYVMDEVASLAERLRLAAQNRAPGNTLAESWAHRISAREQRLRESRLLADMGREIGADLQYIEQQVDDMMRASGSPLDRAACHQHLARVAGGFELLHLDMAAALSRAADGLIDDLGDETVALAGDFAEILCAVQFYLQRLLRGDTAADAVLRPTALRYGCAAPTPHDETATGESEAPVPHVPSAMPEPPPTPAYADGMPSMAEDIQDIYLEEAEGLLAEMRGHVSGALDSEALAAVRRGFHTLKGSSRVARQTALGDAAALIEQSLERVPQGGAHDDALRALLQHAHGRYSEWIAALRAGGVAQPDLGALAAQLAGEGGFAMTEAQAAAPPAEIPAAAGMSAETGSLSAELGRLFLGEASQYVQTLKTGAAGCARGEVPHAEAIRAAHTLAGIARAVKFPALSELAAETERWLETYVARAPQAAEAALLERAVHALAGMVDAVGRGAPLLPADGLAAELRIAVERERRSRQADDPTARLDGDIDAELMRIFVREAREIEAELARAFARWLGEPQDYAPVQIIARALHTLKGGARAAGALTLGEVIHGIETRLSRCLHEGEAPHGDVIASIQDELDAWYAELDRHGGETADAAPPQPAAAGDIPVQPDAWLRVNAAALDRMLKNVGEAAITRSATENDVSLLRQSLQDLNESVGRLRRQVSEIEIEAEKQVRARAGDFARADFDPLEFDRYTRLQELTRLIAESITDVVSLQNNNLRTAADAADSLEREARLNRELRGELTRVRAVTFADAVPRLQRVVRQAARSLGRDAALTVGGEHVEFDKAVLEQLLPPIEHLLRNALAHGIEAPEARAAAGKPPVGEIAIAIRQDVDGFVITLSDDGRGLDFERIRARAAALGFIGADAEPDARELAEVIFMPAFSTSSEVTEVAGRGIGLDAVRAAVAALGGSVSAESRPGGGAVFSMHVPLTVLLVNALLVRAGGVVYAIPAPLVATVRAPQDAERTRLLRAGRDSWMGREYPLYTLSQLMGLPAAAEAARGGKFLLLDDGVHRMALVVEEIVGRQELGIKDTGPQLLRAPGIKGASILGDDQTVLIVNPLLLDTQAETPPEVSATQAARAETRARMVMVVDDSVTVRKITGRLMARAGYQVLLAKDGIEALELLSRARPDAMLLDIEMPRMDGFEVTRRVRADGVHGRLPILVITSRMAQKHRDYALSLGATRYIGKPYDEDALLRDIETCIIEANSAQPVAEAV